MLLMTFFFYIREKHNKAPKEKVLNSFSVKRIVKHQSIMMGYFCFVGKVSRLFIKVFLHFVQNLNLILKTKYSIRTNFNISNLPVQFFFSILFPFFFPN